ncbi:uncharacterized protein UTRI_03791 [Ustilago trichophora]|uniref:Uncharacterized protein n=1 Tax=Ustilago trichophora TaxID=86804 RepID=A0A5C3E225_9BASI|nr:uncharacterized protein UTRI_03791 [Ustilago trichophora]
MPCADLGLHDLPSTDQHPAVSHTTPKCQHETLAAHSIHLSLQFPSSAALPPPPPPPPSSHPISSSHICKQQGGNLLGIITISVTVLSPIEWNGRRFLHTSAIW